MEYKEIEMCGDNEHVRYSLKKAGRYPLIAIGVNPSKARIDKSDQTVTRVMKIAEHNGFDSFVMLNLYPQRSTNPNELHSDKEFNESYHQKNIEEIRHLLSKEMENKPVILVAFGNLIGKRNYLKRCFRDIASVCLPYCKGWKQLGSLTKKGNPRHPLHASHLPWQDFDIDNYLKR